MTRPVPRTTVAAANPEYACGQCGTWHSGPCPATGHHRLGELLARMVREADARVPGERRARRTLQEMAPGYERQPVLILHRPVMADDACPLCGRWSCGGSDCPPGVAPAPACASVPGATGGGQQCANCGGWFGVTALASASARPAPATAWLCGACSDLGL
ncbi:hypothetical protein [Streptomyces scabiei]|uniref:hypothetical protein n=1 Tax=Streptomyces scabiei TaxID=1930 RepID=UPI001B3326EA|nr:hypothetical protein [Streptomyces sp. LBUM 1483]